MTAREWAAKLPAHWADSLIEVFVDCLDLPLSRWEVFDALASYEGGLTAHEARDLIREVYGIDLR